MPTSVVWSALSWKWLLCAFWSSRAFCLLLCQWETEGMMREMFIEIWNTWITQTKAEEHSENVCKSAVKFFLLLKCSDLQSMAGFSKSMWETLSLCVTIFVTVYCMSSRNVQLEGFVYLWKTSFITPCSLCMIFTLVTNRTHTRSMIWSMFATFHLLTMYDSPAAKSTQLRRDSYSSHTNSTVMKGKTIMHVNNSVTRALWQFVSVALQ